MAVVALAFRGAEGLLQQGRPVLLSHLDEAG